MPVPNPYRAADLPSGDLAPALDALSTPVLVEHLRHLDHRAAHQPDAVGRWWLAKLVAAGQRALVRRGLAATAWRPSTDDDR